jgi:UDP-3-O-[3-hydroxymyristoyl] glucosamine N-acyltransferase
MAFLSEDKLLAFGFRKLGKDVKISDKASIYNADLIEIGDYSRIDDFCVLSGRISIGRNVHIAVYCNIAGGTEGVIFEDFSVSLTVAMS